MAGPDQPVGLCRQSTVPVAGSFAEIPIEIGEGGDKRNQKTVSVNVLADEYWDVYSVLLN